MQVLFPIEAILQRVPLGFNLDKAPSGHVNSFDIWYNTWYINVPNSHFLQRVHCVEVKSAVDVEIFTALPDSMSSLFTATQTANGCTGHDARRWCSEYTMAVILFLTFLAVSRHHARAFWAVLLRVSKLNSRLNWLAGASILPDRPRAHVTSMASTRNKFVITPLHGKYPIYKHHALGATPLRLGATPLRLDACKSDISLAGV